MDERRLAAYALGVGAIASLATSGLFGVEVGCEAASRFGPSRQAFRIWGVLFPLSIVSSLLQIFGAVPLLPTACNFATSSAWFWSACWVIAFRYDKTTAAAVLFVAAASCVAACGWVGWWEYAPASLAPSLLAGWLSVAAALGLDIAWREARVGDGERCAPNGENGAEGADGFATRGRRERNEGRREGWRGLVDWLTDGPFLWQPAVLAIVLAGVATAVADPTLTLPLAWAAVWMPVNAGEQLLLWAVCAGGVCGGAVRVAAITNL